MNGHAVRTTTTTVFEGGSAADLANDIQVEVEGILDAQMVLVASKVEFRQARVSLTGLATAVDTTARTITVLGLVVHVDDLTRIDARPAGGGGDSSSLADITPNVDCVEVRGHTASAVLVAERIQELSHCGDPEEIQANVTAKDDASGTLTFFGTLVASFADNAKFDGGGESSLTRAAFFALINPAGPNSQGTLVRLQGTSASGTFVADEAEIQD